jgi:2-amino-4-hydroxy-6-hydroxymethyldihydropteridine diphosphokinase
VPFLYKFAKKIFICEGPGVSFRKKELSGVIYFYMSTVILLLGGNRGDTDKILKQTIVLIENRVGKVKNRSSVYKSPPWGFEDSQWFLNQVVFVESSFSPRSVMKKCQQIEKELGRKKKTTTQYEGRPMDIDILFYNDAIISFPDLIIPHPRLHQRRFTLVPLVEMVPEKIHPHLNKSFRTLLEECSDKNDVIKLLK